MKKVDELLDTLAELIEVEERRQDFDKDDRLIGTYIRYKSGFEVYHPYIPLQIYRGEGSGASPNGSLTEGWRPTRTELLTGNFPFRTRYDTKH